LTRQVERSVASRPLLTFRQNQEIMVKLGPKEHKFNSLVYLQNFMLPNFFFHRVRSALSIKGCVRLTDFS
jgi:hypothetical protein